MYVIICFSPHKIKGINGNLISFLSVYLSLEKSVPYQEVVLALQIYLKSFVQSAILYPLYIEKLFSEQAQAMGQGNMGRYNGKKLNFFGHTTS